MKSSLKSHNKNVFHPVERTDSKIIRFLLWGSPQYPLPPLAYGPARAWVKWWLVRDGNRVVSALATCYDPMRQCSPTVRFTAVYDLPGSIKERIQTTMIGRCPFRLPVMATH